MDWRWAGRTAAVAAVTAALALAAGLPLAGIADEPKPEDVKIAQGKQGNCTVELFSDKRVYKAGEKPVLFLQIANAGAAAEEVEATVTINGTTPFSEMSRMRPRVLGVLWKHSDKFSVPPGETRRFDLPVKITVPEKQSLQFMLKIGSQPAVTQQLMSAVYGEFESPMRTATAGSADSRQ